MKNHVDRETLESEIKMIKLQVYMMHRENEVRLKNLYGLEELVNDQSVDLKQLKKTFGADL